MKPMRVLMVEPSGWGGIALYTHELCTALVEQGLEVRLLNNANRDDLQHLERNYEVVPVVRGDAWSSEWERLRAQIESWKPDIFHMQAAISSRRDLLALLRHHLSSETVRYILTVHNVLPHETAWLERLTFSWMYRLADGLIVHSRASLKALHDLVPSLTTAAEVIHHGHYGSLSDAALQRDDALAQLQLPDVRYLGCFGAIRPYKGVDWLLQAVAAVDAWPEDTRVLVAGNLLTGVSREELEALRSELGIEERVVFRFRYFAEAEIPAIFTVSDLMLFPYRHIDQSGAMMAALAAGKPVVCTPVGAFPEMIDASTGYVSSEVSAESFAVALKRALTERENWGDLGNNARARAKRQYDWKSAAEKTVAFYTRVAGKMTGGVAES